MGSKSEAAGRDIWFQSVDVSHIFFVRFFKQNKNVIGNHRYWIILSNDNILAVDSKDFCSQVIMAKVGSKAQLCEISVLFTIG